MYNDEFIPNYSLWTNHGETTSQNVNVQKDPIALSSSSIGSLVRTHQRCQS